MLKIFMLCERKLKSKMKNLFIRNIETQILKSQDMLVNNSNQEKNIDNQNKKWFKLKKIMFLYKK